MWLFDQIFKLIGLIYKYTLGLFLHYFELSVFYVIDSVLRMLKWLRRIIFPNYTERALKRFRKQAKKIASLEEEYSKLTDEQLKAKTQEFRDRLMRGETLDDILVDAFATVRETAWRTRREKPFLCQIIGGITLHHGMVAEMATGEGKTLTASMPVYLNALTGEGVHVVTVNDYLAQRDADNMGKIYKFLGLTVGCLHEEMHAGQRKEVYDMDIIYGTAHAFGFDYLKDNMQTQLDHIMQRGFHYAIIDELDKVLIDDAVIPMILSGEGIEASALCEYADAVAKKFVPEDYEIEAKSRSVHLNMTGYDHLEAILKSDHVLHEGDNIFSDDHALLLHHIRQALIANTVYQNGVQYVVMSDKVMIIDESTGRILADNRYSFGLHQALEAKEKVTIQKENKTVATITYQRFFDMYDKKSGMTGTAASEREELLTIYGLHVVQIPTNKPIQRIDMDDRVYFSFQEKLEAVVDFVKKCHDKKQPILLGTSSVESSEIFSNALNHAGIKHRLLNAKNPTEEAEIIAQAGRLSAVTVAAKMAGRGTDIKLGGNVDFMLSHIDQPTPELIEKLRDDVAEEAQAVLNTGGLMVIGAERDMNMRIDNQLRGRSGRQGDRGASVFFISFDDVLFNRGENAAQRRMLLWLKPKKHGEVISDPWVTKTIASLQKRMEAHNFEGRKYTLRYNNVLADQGQFIYQERYKFLTHNDVFKTCVHLRDMLLDTYIKKHFRDKYTKDTQIWQEFANDLHAVIKFNIDIAQLQQECNSLNELTAALQKALKDNIQVRPEVLEDYSKHVCLTSIDRFWMKHLVNIENLKQGINLRSYGQKDPLNEFKKDAFKLFEHMMEKFNEDVVRRVFVDMSEQ